MVDGVLLLVDASEGPLPQTRFVLRKALEARLPVVLVVNKVDRPDARTAEVVNEVYELFLDLDADEEQIDFPIVYANAAPGSAGLEPDELARTSSRSFDTLLATVPLLRTIRTIRCRRSSRTSTLRPTWAGSRCSASATGRCARASRSPGAAPTGRSRRAQVTELYVTEALDRVPADEAGPGEIVALAGLPEVTIGETIADPNDPRPLPVSRSTSRPCP